MKVALLYGGKSPERDVSLSTGKAVAKGLAKAGHEVIEYEIDENKIIDYLNDIAECDIAFIGYHGEAGEDGKVQALLELAGIKYTGSGPKASAIAMDKKISKIMLQHAGVSTADWICIQKEDLDRKTLEKIAEIGFPLAVKPSTGGSTIGFTKVDLPADIEKAVEKAAKYSSNIIVEKFIEGSEVTVSVLGKRILPPLLIRPSGGLYDYKHKYTKGLTEYICPAPIDQELAANFKKQAKKAFEELGCKNYGRVDFRLSKKNEMFCLEVNTLPGMTDLSLVPMAANALGISFEQMLDIIVNDALGSSRK